MYAINQQQVSEDRRRSWTITIIVHALLLLLCLLPFITNTPDNQEFLQAIVINFEEPPQFEDSSTKMSGASAAAASAESASPEQEQAPREQVAVAAVTPSQPTTMMPVPAREIVTTEAKPEIYVPTSKQNNSKSDNFFDQPLEVEDRVEVDRVEAFKQKPNPELQQKIVWQVAEAPAAEKGAPDSFEFGSGGGTTSGSGTKSSGGGGTAPAGDREDGSGFDPFGDGSFGGEGTGDGNKGGKTGFGNDGDGLRYGSSAGDGLFNREVIERCDIAKVASIPGKVVIKMCVDQQGNTVYAQYDNRWSDIKDKSVLEKFEACAKNFVWKPDSSAPKEQCGYYTFFVEIKK